MSNQTYHLSPSTSRKRFSREGFQPLAGSNTMESNNNNNNDATIDIPLEPVQTNSNSSGGGSGGLRNIQSQQAMQRQMSLNKPQDSQKRGFFQGRRAKRDASNTHRGYEAEEYRLTTMGKIYKRVLNFSIITRYFLYVSPLAILIAVPIVIGALIEDSNPKNPPLLAGVPLVWFFTWVEIVWLSLWVSKIVAHFLPAAFQLFVGVVSSGVRKYAKVIEKLEIPLSLVGWAVTSLATFIPLMTKNPWNRALGPNHINIHQDWEKIVQEILAASVVASLIFLGEKLFIQLISINYHHKQFNGKIKESKHKLWLLGLMLDASHLLFPQFSDEFAEEDYIIIDQLQLAALGRSRNERNHARSGSTTPMRLLQEVHRVGDKLTSAFGNVAHEITGKEVFNPTASHSIVVQALEKKATSEALARRVWMSFVAEGREELVQDDVIEVLGEDKKAEAEEAFWALDCDGNGDVSLDEMIYTVTEWGRERKALATSMVDVAQAINVLDRLLITVALIAILFIFVAFLNKDFTTTLATAGTALLSMSFVFSTSAQEVLGSCIFLFVKHPFDIGDRVDIASDEFVVEHISLLFTVFRRIAGPKTGQLVQYANIVLNTLALENISRSKQQTEQFTLNVAFGTSFEDIQTLKSEMRKFVNDKDNSRDFQPEMDVEVLGTTDMSMLQLKVEIKHKGNWGNETVRASRRSKFMCALVAALRAVPIDPPGGSAAALGSAANPNYAVSISDVDAKKNAATSAETKEKARLVPTKMPIEVKGGSGSQPAGFAGLTTHDTKVLDDLNYRNPADAAEDDSWPAGRDDSSTLGERNSTERQDLESVRGLLRRESSKGKRKPSMEGQRSYAPSVPTINEPGSYGNYGQPPYAPSSYENQRPSNYSTMPTSYVPPPRSRQAMPYLSQTQSQTQQQQVAAANIEMSQVSSSQRYQTDPYRERSESRRLFNQSSAEDQDQDQQSGGNDDFDNPRPYSGV